MILLLMLAAAINKTVSVIKAIGKDTNLVVTQLVVWAVGIVGILLASQAEVMASLVIPGIGITDPLGELDFASLVVLGWVLGSTGSFAYDFKKARDSNDSAREPALLASANRRSNAG